MAPNVTLHFFPANDLNGSILHEITDEDEYFRGLELKIERDGIGGAELTLARKVGFAGFGSGTFNPEVFVRILVHAYSDTEYYPWGFFLNKREQTVIHVDEDGGEVFRFGGAGPKQYLDRAVLGIGTPSTGWNLDLVNGVWRWTDNATVGRILTRIINQDSTEDDPALPDLTYTFTDPSDSDSVAWADDDLSGSEDNLYEIPIGTSLLTALFDLDDLVELTSWVELGTVASPKFELNVIQGLGEDRTGSSFGAGTVLLKEGVNIADSSLEIVGNSLKKATHVIVEGKNGKWALAEKPGFSSGEYVKYAKIEYMRSGSVYWLEKAGIRWLKRQDYGEKELAVGIVPGASDGTGYYFPAPDRDLWLNNLISVDTSADGMTHTPLDIQPSEDQLVTGFLLSLREAGDTATADKKAKSWDVKVQLNRERPGNVNKTPNQSSASSGNGGCTCHNPPRFPPECLPNPGDETVIDWDWTACVNPSFVDAFSGGAPTNPWGGGTSGSPHGANGCGGETNHNSYSLRFAVTPGDTLHVAWKNAKYGAGSPTTSNFRIRFLTSDGSTIVSNVDQSLGTGTWSLNHGGYANWVTGTGDYLVPATAAYARVTQTTWSAHETQRLTITVAGDAPIDVEDCVDYQDFPHDSPYALPSDYLLARLEEIELGLDKTLDELLDVNAPTPAEGDILVWDDTAGEWVTAAPDTGVTDHGALTGLADDDHPQYVTHTELSASGAAGEILISDTPSTPLVFADLLQNEAQDDLLYGDL